MKTLKSLLKEKEKEYWELWQSDADYKGVAKFLSQAIKEGYELGKKEEREEWVTIPDLKGKSK